MYDWLVGPAVTSDWRQVLAHQRLSGLIILLSIYAWAEESSLCSGCSSVNSMSHPGNSFLVSMFGTKVR
jgi:hypothetical protein